MCNWKKWIWPWGLLPLILAVIAILMKSGPVEEELTGRAGQALNAQHGWANVSLDGRDLTLSGTAPTEAAKAEALQLANDAYDVRIVKDGTDLLALASPYDFGADIDGNAITLRGNVPTEAARATLIEAAKASNPSAEITDNTTLARGANVAFPALAAFGAAKLADLSSGSVDISDADFSIKGVAKTSDTFENVTSSVNNALPEGGTLALSEITPPALDGDYQFSATLDETPTVTLEGYAPNIAARSALTDYASTAFPDAKIENKLALAAGAPEGYDAASKFAIDQLPRFKSGSASFSGSDFTVSGVSSTSDDFTASRAAIAGALPAGLLLGSSAIVPPSVDGEYSMSAAKTDGSLRLSGLAPSTEMRDAIASSAATSNPGLEIVNDLKIAAGAPTNMAWDQAAGFGLGQMASLRDGSMSLNGKGLSVSGEAIDGPSFEALNAMASADLPEGLAITNVDVQLPSVSPYIWSATKGDNSVFLSGYAPSADVKDANVAAAKAITASGSVIDQQVLGAGAPGGYSVSTDQALKALGMLEKGKASYLDGMLTVDGDAKDLASKEAVFAMLENAQNVSSTIRSPIIEPYIWSATKGDGSVFLSGYVPNEAVKTKNVEAAKALTSSGAVIDQQVLAEGVTTGYGSGIQYGLDALKSLETGKAEYSAGTLTITGHAAEFATKLTLDDTLEAKAPAFTKVSATITSPQPPAPELPELPTPPAPPEAPVIPEPEVEEKPAIPVASPYVWSMVKTSDNVMLSGHMPSQSGMDFAFDKAKTVAEGLEVKSDMTLASGAPAGFGSAVAFGSDILGRLVEGEARYKGKVLSINGRAIDHEMKERLDAEVANNSLNFTVVTSNITSPPKPEPIKVDPCDALVRDGQGARYINFATNSAELTGSLADVDAIISIAQRCPTTTIEIAGHTDSQGAEAYNQNLSEARASSVREYMINSGNIDGARIQAIGLGETQPIADNKTAEGRALNRRIAFSISQ